MSWFDDVVVGYDSESTAMDPMEARLVTASLVQVYDEIPFKRDWLVAVEEPIPAEATAIHGVTTERAHSDGRPLGQVVREVCEDLGGFWSDGNPVVVFNAPYDLTLINQESRRCGFPVLSFTETTTPILDPLVIDRELDKYRKGSRKLGDMCKHYGVTLDNAHTSSADAIAAVEVMLKLVEAFPKLRRMSLQHLYRLQAVWYTQWASNYQSYLRDKAAAARATDHAILDITVDQSWPVRIPVEEPLPVGDRQ